MQLVKWIFKKILKVREISINVTHSVAFLL